MNQFEQLNQLIKEHGGTIQTFQVLEAGISKPAFYTEAGKSVSVYMDGCRLVIENECNPIPDSEINRLFEPFYRPDFSRSRDSGGNGLGHYIVDTLLTSMNISYAFAPMKSPAGMQFTIQMN